MYVSKAPYLQTKEDLEVVIQGIKNLQKAIAKVPEIVWEVPAPNVTVEDYVNGAGKYFLTNGFFESAIVNKVQRFGNIAQVFSSYQSRHAAADVKPFTRGINSMQLFYDGKRWWVLSILWDEESPSNPLPSEMAKRSAAPATQQ